ncbi:hypothetical protein JVT61DRAFT_69 [Boletus reticuloceps]|uniref:Uncharacterized protein n=1 Tax=Boletus reticuloceps TaxID=495285 RepID=A0A8I3ADM1_9AGAM|nr:hypothetical protein JVT61DRAFT_69 [Boletus reticuloceps]
MTCRAGSRRTYRTNRRVKRSRVIVLVGQSLLPSLSANRTQNHIEKRSLADLTKFDHDIAVCRRPHNIHLHPSEQRNIHLCVPSAMETTESISFVIQFAQMAEPLSLSTPLLLHNWRDIVKSWITAVDAAQC